MKRFPLFVPVLALVIAVPLAVAVAGPADGPAVSPPPAGHMGGHMGGAKHGPGMMLMMADADQDGVVTRAEFEAMARKHFDEVDADHDGKVTQAEVKVAHDAMRAKMGEHREARREAMRDQSAARFQAADKNADGKLSPEEAKAMPMVAEHFTHLDTNKDGSVSIDEIAAVHRKP